MEATLLATSSPAPPSDSCSLFSPYIGKDQKTETAQISPVGFPAPIPASLLQEGKAGAHLWHGFLWRGEITLLSALWKVGKTTLLARLLKALETGSEFCGRQTLAARVLYVTEETQGRWAERRDAVGIADHVDFLVRPFMGKPDYPRWMALLAYLTELIQDRKYDVLVLDTIANLWPVRDENDASGVMTALMPLHQIGPSTGILAVHHNRKGDGQEATATRGSGALPGFVDTIVELRRFAAGKAEDRSRVLTGYGRHDETPSELVLEYTDAGDYLPQGSRSDVRGRELSEEILVILPTSPPGLKIEDVIEQLKISRHDATAVLQQWAGIRWQREGNGKRGSPYTFWRSTGEQNGQHMVEASSEGDGPIPPSVFDS